MHPPLTKLSAYFPQLASISRTGQPFLELDSITSQSDATFVKNGTHFAKISFRQIVDK